VSEFSPAGAQKFLSYITGWLCVLGWQVNIAAGSYLVATQIQGVIALNDASYVAQPWHATLMIIAVAAVAILFNTFFAKKLPLIEGVILIIHVFGFFGVLIPLWALAPRKSAEAVFTEFTNDYGWPSQGVGCLVGIIGPMYSLIGPDSAVHMAEEIKDASRVLPLGMMWTLVLNGVTGFIMVITFAFCIGDLGSAINPKYSYAYIGTFYTATGNKAGSTVMACLIILMCLCSTISNVATASRQMFAFARDRGMPFSTFLCRYVSRQTLFPPLTSNHEHQRPTWLGHPAQRRLRLLRHHLPLIPDQPRQQRRLQRHRLSHRRRNPKLLHHLDFMCRATQNPRRPSAARSLEPWPCWSRLQYYCSALPGTGLYLCIFPAGDAG
jgi:hypothetical protein